MVLNVHRNHRLLGTGRRGGRGGGGGEREIVITWRSLVSDMIWGAVKDSLLTRSSAYAMKIVAFVSTRSCWCLFRRLFVQDPLHHIHRRSRDVPETIGFALPLCKQKAMQWLSILFSLDYIRYSKYYTKAALTWPAPVAQWLARRTVGRKAWGSNPIRVMWDFSALAGSYPELGVLWAQWEGWNHTAEFHPLHGCVFEGVALITWPTLQVLQFPGLVNTGIIVTVSVGCGPVK